MITDFKNLVMNRKIYFGNRKIEFRTHWESVHNAEFLALEKALNVYNNYIGYLMFYSCR